MARFLTLHHLPPDDDLHTPLGMFTEVTLTRPPSFFNAAFTDFMYTCVAPRVAFANKVCISARPRSLRFTNVLLGFVNMLHGIDRVMKREDELYQVDSGRVFSVSRRYEPTSATSIT